MYRVMIIDDEKSVRSLIKKLVDWEKYDAEIVGEAESGIEAINMLDEIKPDIVFVDIRMPFMDGLTFMKYMTEIYSDIMMIVVTAHSEFDYAKQCIQLGVKHYLLKPISKKEINEAFADVISKVNKEKVKEEGEKVENINQYVAYIKEHYEKPQISLSFMAKKFGFNATYFSRKFKEVTGQSFVECLTAYRISKACEYAKQGKMMYETAEMVGIPDVSYFSKCFKKYMGISYTEYVTQEKV